MANTLTNIMPKILARGLLALRQQVIMPSLVNGDYSSEAKEKGDTIDVPISVAQTASDVTPSNTPPAPASKTPGKVQITLNNWKHSDFHLNDKELTQIDRQKHFMPLQMSEAIKALANAVNIDIMSNYAGVYGYVGTAGTTPFATTVDAATNARKTLHQQLCPRDQRRAVLNFDAEANALALAPFRDVSQSADQGPIKEGHIGRKYGIDWYADDHVPTHTAGTVTGLLVNNGTLVVGTTTITTDTGSGTLLAGDIITFAGHTQTYVVISSVGGSTVTSVEIYPPLVAAIVNDEAITRKATHVANLVFHREAFAFATRPLMAETVDLELGNKIMSLTDPKSGIALRLEVSRQYKQVVWDFDILWGSKLIRPELATRIAG